MIRYFLGILIAALLFVSCNSSSDSTVFVQKDTTTTFMVYLPGTDLEADGPNDLAGNASKNITSMMQAADSTKLNIIVQTGAADINYNDTPTNEYATPVKDWTNVKRHKVINKDIIELENVGKSCLNRGGTDCIEMGTPDALANFIRYTVKNYPADRYILVLWDHGGGPIDGYGGGAVKTMDTNDMLKAFDTVKDEVKFDIIGFDTCLLGSLELAYNLKNYSKYLLASEELEPGLGWNYGTPLDAIAKNPNISNPEIGKLFIDEFITLNKRDSSLTLSLTDLSKVDAIVTALDAFSLKASELFNANNANKNSQWVKIFKARSQADEYAKDSISKQYVNTADIGDFADILKAQSGADYGTVAAALSSALKNAIVYNRTDAVHEQSQGLSIYFPFNFNGNPNTDLAMTRYNNIYYNNKLASFSANYKTLLTDMIDHAQNTASTLPIGLTPTVQGQYFTAEVTSNFNIDTSIVLIDSSVNPNETRFLTARPATVMDKQLPDQFNVIGKIDNKALALDGFPVFMSLEGREGLYSQNLYAFSIPAYVLTPDEENQDIQNAPLATLATLTGYFDFNSGKGELSDSATPSDSMGRDDIYLDNGVQIMIPVSIINNTTGEKTLEKTNNIITITEKGAAGVKFELVDLNTTGRLAFYITDLKGTGVVSNFINADGTPVVRSLERDGTTDNLETLANALAQPIK